jgi:O-antigen/teichoic acid export membrane protein
MNSEESILTKIQRQLKDGKASEILIVFSFQAFALLSSLAISLFVTNLLGAAAYGVFSFGFSAVNLAAVICCMGFEQLALKEIPSLRAGDKKDLIRGYFLYSLKNVFVVSIIASIAIFAISYFINHPADQMLRFGLWLAIPVLPFIALINLRLSWLRSFHFNALSQFPDKIIRPAVFLMMVLLGYIFFREQLNVSVIIIISGISILIAFIVSKYLVRKKIGAQISGIPPAYNKIQWTQVALSLLLVNGIYFYMSQIQILALGSLRGARETGIFAIASRLSDLEGYMLFAMNVVLAPMISKLFAENKIAELQKLITGSLRIGFFLSLPIIICFLLFPSFFLSFFGGEFAEAKFALIILTLSQVVNFATGSVGYLLTMTGHQNTAIKILLLSALLTTLLCVLLINDLGVNGAAIAAAINNVVLNVLMAIAVKRKTGINATLLNFK